MKKNCVEIKIIKGNISNNIDGRFNIVSNIGYPIPILSWSLKNFNSSKIFKTNISDEKINHFQELWQSDKLDTDDRETIWTWMECFIKISDCYFKKYGYINGWEKIE